MILKYNSSLILICENTNLLLQMPCIQYEKYGVYLSADFKHLYFTVLTLSSSKRTYWVFKYLHVNSVPSEAFQQRDKKRTYVHQDTMYSVAFRASSGDKVAILFLTPIKLLPC
jgi:hypothetical protein